MNPMVYAIASLDTKGHEMHFVAECLRAFGVETRLVDVGTGEAPSVTPDITRNQIAGSHPRGGAFVLAQTDRGAAVTAMSEALVPFLTAEFAEGRVAGVIGLGGTGGSALLAPAFRSLPIGVPKILVSTVASGDTRGFIDCSDLILFPSIVDIAGLNVISRAILANAAHAMAGMVQHRAATAPAKSAIGITMFGVTTPCTTAVRRELEREGFDVLVFHATGVGGRTMEKLVESGLLRGVLDLTTTEVADEIVGGIFPAGPARFEGILRSGVPYVLSLGALDMVNFGAEATVPERYRHRTLHRHNAQITLMRTTPEENRQIARWIAGKLNAARGPFTLLIPEKGVSALDAPGQAFHGPAANQVLFDELKSALQPAPQRKIVSLPLHINDPKFADAAVEAFLELFPDKP